MVLKNVSLDDVITLTWILPKLSRFGLNSIFFVIVITVIDHGIA